MMRIPARVLADTLEQIVERKFPYQSKKEKKVNWSAYNRAKIERLEQTLSLIREYVDAVELVEVNPGAGRPPENTVKDKAKAVLLTEFFQLDERSASGFVSLFKEKLGISENMSPRTIGRAYYDSQVQEILEQVIKATNKPIQGLTTSFSGDGKGFSKSNKTNWARDKEDLKKHKDFNTATMVSSNDFHIISAFEMHSSPSNECPDVIPLFNQAHALHPCMNSFQYDAGGISRENIQHITNAGVTPYIFPKRNLTLKPLGKPAWTNMLYDCITNTQQWLQEYHARSQSETTNSCLERQFPKPINCKKEKGQLTEKECRFALHNITQLITAHYEHGIPLITKE